MDSAVPVECGPITAATNQRRHYRYRIRNLSYVTLGPDNGGILRDISETGMAVQSVRPLMQNDYVPVRFELLRPKGRVEASGKVVWADAIGQAGLQFTDISQRSQRFLKEWLFTQVLQAGQASAESIFAAPQPQVTPEPIPEELAAEAEELLLHNKVVDVPWWPFPLTSGRLARIVDGLAVSSAVLLFAVISLLMTRVFPGWWIVVALTAVVAAMFAGVYWILFTVCFGATPGGLLAGHLLRQCEPADERDQPRFR